MTAEGHSPSRGAGGLCNRQIDRAPLHYDEIALCKNRQIFLRQKIPCRVRYRDYITEDVRNITIGTSRSCCTIECRISDPRR